ncbi:hypothetical protein BHM03_00042852 [Ensete ventricosum]|nr:hypothetical protein BHM03_00042852 [Ensete ventricosum]
MLHICSWHVKPRFAISIFTAWYRWYIPVPRLPVRGPPATERFRQRSTVDGRLKGEIDHRRSIEGEIDRRRSIEREKGRKKKKRKKKKRPIARAPSSLSRGSLALFLPRGEKDRGDLRFWASYRGQTLARTGVSVSGVWLGTY